LNSLTQISLETAESKEHNAQIWSRIIPLKKEMVAGVTVLTLESGILLLVR